MTEANFNKSNFHAILFPYLNFAKILRFFLIPKMKSTHVSNSLSLVLGFIYNI